MCHAPCHALIYSCTHVPTTGHTPPYAHTYLPACPVLDFFRALPPERVPPKVMLHSFGGSVELLAAFVGLPRVGGRFYFSFSEVINGKGGCGRDKLVARIQAVPEDRLLAESDQNSALKIDDALKGSVQMIAEAKG